LETAQWYFVPPPKVGGNTVLSDLNRYRVADYVPTGLYEVTVSYVPNAPCSETYLHEIMGLLRILP
jgi:hypothetical protein